MSWETFSPAQQRIYNRPPCPYKVSLDYHSRDFRDTTRGAFSIGERRADHESIKLFARLGWRDDEKKEGEKMA